MRAVAVTVNGVAYERQVEDRLLLADFLRDELALTGTKLGCSHGACGSCTVHVDSRPVRSCLMFAAQVDGRAVRTVEGLATVAGDLHPLQAAFWEEHGLQCGYCTPGFLMTALGFVESGRPLDERTVREAISGNICRCTGYEGIVRAVTRAARELQAHAT